MKLKLAFFLSIAFGANMLVAHAQNRAPQAPLSISGRIIDATTSEPIEYATISVFKMPDSTLVTGASAGAKGLFNIDGLQPGSYSVVYSFIGYKQGVVSKVVLSRQNKNVNLGDLKLDVTASEIGAVTVTGEKGVMLNKIDRKVFTVDKTIAGQTGSITDVLQNIPSVAVDVDGNVSLRGSENVTILINGKPSTLSGSSRAAILQQLPANSVESIEVITNPSAKFESDGNSGIINIVMKKSFSQGFNGSVTANVGNQERANGNVSLSYNPGKYNVFFNYGIRKNYNDRSGTNYTERTVGDTVRVLDQTSKDPSSGYSHTARLGGDYNFSESLSAGLSSTFALRNKDGNEVIDYNEYAFKKSTLPTTFNKYERSTIENEDGFNTDFAAYLQKKFSEGHELRFDASYSQGDETEKSDYDEYLLDDSHTILSQENTDNDSKEELFLISSDYTKTLDNKMKLEFGFKSTFRNNIEDLKGESKNLVTNLMEKDPDKTSNFDYKDQVHAAYGTVSQEFGIFGYMAGLRFEDALVNSTYKTKNDTASSSRSFPVLIPTLHFTQKWDDKNQTQLSYSRRARRPNMHQLNPITDYTDPRNLRVGNPELKPQYENNFEFSYMYTSGRNSFSPTLFHKITENQFSMVSYDVSPTVMEHRQENIKSTSSTGLEFVSNVAPMQFWTLNLNSTFFYYKMSPTDTVVSTHKDNLNFSARVISTMTLTRSTVLQITGFYRSPFISTQGKSKPMYGMDLGVRQNVLGKNGTITLNVNDVFNTQQFGMDIEVPGRVQHVNRKWKSQPIIFLGFTYRFGETQKTNKQRERKNNDAIEMDNSGEMM